MTKILIFKEKHGSRYFAASTMREIDAACKKVLKERLEQKYYEPYLGTLPDVLAEELIAQLPEEYQQKERKKIRTRESFLDAYEKEKEFFEDVKDCIKEAFDGDEKCLPWSFSLLNVRSYGEYEGLEVEKLEEV